MWFIATEAEWRVVILLSLSLSSPRLDAHAQPQDSPRLVREFGVFLLAGKENSPVQIQRRLSLRGHARKHQWICADTHTHTRFLNSAACALTRPRWRTRRVSGPALVRTAPALPAPWNPKLHAPASCPSLTSSSANQEASAAATSPPAPARTGRGATAIG